MRLVNEALEAMGLSDEIAVLPVLSGYPSPKYVNLVLRRSEGSTFLFETSAARPDIVEQVTAALDDQGVDALDALLVTHCHGDHGGSAASISKRGRPEGERAPIYLHSAGYRFMTQPAASFLQETYELFLARSHWGMLDYSSLSDEQILENAIRNRYANYFERVPKRALRFVDHGNLPEGILAVFTPGHSHDCVLYWDRDRGVAVPGDTIICKGDPADPETHAYVIPIFTVAGQTYSMAYERYIRTIRVLKKFFSTYRVDCVIPPHGRFAVTEPLEWVSFAEGYFEGIYRSLREDFLAEHEGPFRAMDLNPYIPTAGSHPISTPSHSFGMLCMLADDGFLDMQEDERTRQILFEVAETPPADYVTRMLAKDPGPLPIFGTI
jgi:glyoxylase-like metal-dependent hydrolase (beta-lactamase superfamily II)